MLSFGNKSIVPEKVTKWHVWTSISCY
jgi:hypothetical protein